MNTITAHVTDDDIAYGRQRNNSGCAIAMALKDADPEIERVRVTRDTITFSHRGDDMRYTVRQPRTGTRFVDAFDTDEGRARVKPFHITIVPEEAIRSRPVKHATTGSERMKRTQGKRKGRPRAAAAPGRQRASSYRPPVTAMA